MKTHVRLNPPQVLVLGFAAVIAVGALVLTLPVSSVSRHSAGFIDALFTSTSAVCVTGLVVRDTLDGWSLFGQIVIILLIQAGGLGFMTMATLVLMLMGRRIGLKERLVIQESLNEFSLKGLVMLIKRIVILTFLCELAGAAILSTRFIPQFGFATGLYTSLFHSVSAFCNAGFDLMGGYRSLTGYTDDFVVCTTFMALIVVGGLGFTVVLDLFREKKFSRLTLHSKLVLVMTGILILSGAVFFALVEWGNPKTLAAGGMTVPDKVLAAFFQSVTARTAGFNTISQDGMTAPGKFMTVILMFIGASPAGTGGGVKTTTFAVLLLMVWMVVKGRSDITLFKRRLPKELAFRSAAIILIAFVCVMVVLMAVSLLEQHNISPYNTFENLMFETVSAFGTVGLSSGITPTLSPGSKLFLTALMFIGRLGPLTLTLAFTRGFKGEPKFHYLEDKVAVG